MNTTTTFDIHLMDFTEDEIEVLNTITVEDLEFLFRIYLHKLKGGQR